MRSFWYGVLGSLPFAWMAQKLVQELKTKLKRYDNTEKQSETSIWLR